MHCSHCGAKKWTCLCRFTAEWCDDDKLRADKKEYTQLLDKIYTTRKEVGNEN